METLTALDSLLTRSLAQIMLQNRRNCICQTKDFFFQEESSYLINYGLYGP